MVTAYPVANKKKSHDICSAFVRGCGGLLSSKLRDGAAAFYGVDASNIDIWREVKTSGREYFYIDNSYFDSNRQQRFRVTRNALQHTGAGESSGARFAELGIEIKPWQTGGSHIVVCPQSQAFMDRIVRYVGEWLEDVRSDAAAAGTELPLRVRPWSANKTAIAATLADDLVDAHALVTWSSAAAITAVLSGVPVIVGADDCAASRMSGTWQQIENLPRPEREQWAGVLADNEWSLDEMSSGTAWRQLHE